MNSNITCCVTLSLYSEDLNNTHCIDSKRLWLLKIFVAHIEPLLVGSGSLCGGFPKIFYSKYKYLDTIWTPKSVKIHPRPFQTKRVWLKQKNYLIFSGTVPFRNHHGRRWWLFGDMLSIPLPPTPSPLSGWWWKAAGAKWPRSIQPQSRTLPCILSSCYNPIFFLYFSWGIFHRKKPFFAQGIVQPSSFNTRLFFIFHEAIQRWNLSIPSVSAAV